MFLLPVFYKRLLIAIMRWALEYAALFLGSMALAGVMTWLVRSWALRWKILDYPTAERKIHRQPIPLLGGWALYLTMAVMTISLWLTGRLAGAHISPALLGGFFLAGGVLMLGGFLDDRQPLRWYQSLVFPLIAAAVVIVAGLQVAFVTNPFGGLLYLNQWPAGTLKLFGHSRVWLPLADSLSFLWLLATMYTTKLLDGLDGLASSVSGIAALVIFGVSLFWDAPQSITSYIAIILAGSLAGFLLWNWHPAKIFLGESGSTFIGFSLGVLSILTGGKIATALLVMGLPMLDVAWSIIRRVRSGHNPMSGDDGHIHFRFLQLGWSQRQVVLFMSFLALLFGSVSFFTTSIGKIIALGVLLIAMIGLLLFITPKKKYEK
jgi:UDP-GlcNAc:undecaprenyl-phosphate GlcNAc-1-phosphate transferase